MSLDFQQVRQQIIALGEVAPGRQLELDEKRALALALLAEHAEDFDGLRRRVRQTAQQYDASLRCACPADPENHAPERLNGSFQAGQLPARVTLLAADGSQIAPDRHAPVEYCLINVGAIQMRRGSADAPEMFVNSQMFYDETLNTPTGRITDARLALMRDLEERTMLAALAEFAPAPVISFADGPMELWGARNGEGESYFQQSLEKYKNVLRHLHNLKVITAGYIDKPGANLVVRMLELLLIEDQALRDVRRRFPLRGVRDTDLFFRLLGPGERSAVFALQSASAVHYTDELGLHFFYLNVGKPGRTWIARVEVPAWVARSDEALDYLQAVLVEQCRIMGDRPYPYMLHRAHEAAVVTHQEREQVTNLIMIELRRRGLEVGLGSFKQAAKDLDGRKSYKP